MDAIDHLKRSPDIDEPLVNSISIRIFRMLAAARTWC